MCGMICSKDRVEHLTSAIIAGTMNSLQDIHQGLIEIYNAYLNDEWYWMLTTFEKLHQRRLADESAENMSQFIEKWKVASLKLLNMVLQDAEKEFEGNVKTGFGIDGNMDQDFESVRGSFDTNQFKNQIEEEIEKVEQKHRMVKELIGE